MRVVWVAFAPTDSNFPLQVSFPIFLSNALDWLMENTAQPLGSLSPGSPIALPHGGHWVVTRPGGSQDALTCSEAAGAACSYSGTLSAGVYVATQGAERQVYAVDISSAAESDLAPRPLAFAGTGTTASPAPPAEALSRDLWTWAAAFALLLLMLEWLAYHRRL